MICDLSTPINMQRVTEIVILIGSKTKLLCLFLILVIWWLRKKSHCGWEEKFWWLRYQMTVWSQLTLWDDCVGFGFLTYIVFFFFSSDGWASQNRGEQAMVLYKVPFVENWPKWQRRWVSRRGGRGLTLSWMRYFLCPGDTFIKIFIEVVANIIIMVSSQIDWGEPHPKKSFQPQTDAKVSRSPSFYVLPLFVGGDFFFRYLGGSERLSENGSRQETVRSSQISGRQIPGQQITGQQISGRQLTGSKASGKQKDNGATSRLLVSGRQASQEGPARLRKGNAEQLQSSRQRAAAGGSSSQGPRQQGQQSSSSRQQAMRRAVSSPKLDFIPERSLHGNNIAKRGGKGNSTSVPRLQLDFSSSSASTVLPHGSRSTTGEGNRWA